MKSEDEPITDEEWLIRLVCKERHRPDRLPIITQSSFEPRRDELSGISLFRRDCLDGPLHALGVVAEAKRDDYAVVQLRVALVQELGCSVRSDPIPQVAGHVLVPEINYLAYRANKPQLEEWFLRLAHEASANILRRPLA